jgi:hypothetical protein
MRKVEGNTPFGKYVKVAWAKWAKRGPSDRRGKAASTGGAGPDGPKFEESSFSNKNWIFEYSKALEIFTRRFRRNFDKRIFPKIF